MTRHPSGEVASMVGDALILCGTPRFSVLSPPGDHSLSTDAHRRTTRKTKRRPHTKPQNVATIFLDINEAFTRNVIVAAFDQRRDCFELILGPGEGGDPVPVPTDCMGRPCFQFAEYERIDWDRVVAGRHGASSYCVRKGLSRKAQLAHYTHLHCCKNPGSVLATAMPQTRIIDTWSVWDDSCGGAAGGLAGIIVGSGPSGGAGDVSRKGRLDSCLEGAKDLMERLERDYEEGRLRDYPVWILKPSTINKGAGIRIVHCIEQVMNICWEESDIREWVLQQYIRPPLLLRSRKFHIRAYALAVSAIRVYFYDRCLALCSGTKYNEDDTDNVLAHITNTAYQSIDPNFREEDCVLLWDEDVPDILVTDGTCPNLNDARIKTDHVLRHMRCITAELFRAYENEYGVFAPLAGCFEQYGLDFVVDERFGVYLLEVNPGPDFKQTGARLSRVIEEFMGDTIDVALLGEKRCDDLGENMENEVAISQVMEPIANKGLTLVYENQVRGPPMHGRKDAAPSHMKVD